MNLLYLRFKQIHHSAPFSRIVEKHYAGHVIGLKPNNLRRRLTAGIETYTDQLSHRENPQEPRIGSIRPVYGDLIFDSRFESGNLFATFKVCLSKEIRDLFMVLIF